MSTMIQIRHVPDSVHRKLKARAAREGMSLSAYLLKEVEYLAKQLSWAEMEARISGRAPVILKESSVEALRAERDNR